MNRLRLRKRATGSPPGIPNEIQVFADGDGELQKVASDGTVSPVGTGAQGDPGVGVPAGGATGETLAKASNADYDTEWVPPGGSQPGAVRRLDLGIVAATDLADGIVTLYTPEAGEIVGPVYLYDVVFCDNSGAVVLGRDEQVAADANFPPLAAWDSDLSFDGAGFAGGGDGDLHQVPLTTGPVTVGLSNDASTLGIPVDTWQAGHVYVDSPIPDEVVEAGHLWYALPGGTSGGSRPDFEGNIGGTVTDNDITWNDNSAVPTVGSAHVYADVTIPDTP